MNVCPGGGSYHINPTSEVNNKQHLSYFRFVGRILGKAIMEQQAIKANLSLPLRKQILSIPITFSDLEFVDDELYRNLIWLKHNENVSNLMLDFSISYALATPPTATTAGGGNSSSSGADSNNNNGSAAPTVASSGSSNSSSHVVYNNSSEAAGPMNTYTPPSTNSLNHIIYELIPNGAEILVTDENKEEYLQLRSAP